MCIHHPHFLHACIRTCSFVVVNYNRRYSSRHLRVKLRTFSCSRDTRYNFGLVGTGSVSSFCVIKHIESEISNNVKVKHAVGANVELLQEDKHVILQG